MLRSHYLQESNLKISKILDLTRVFESEIPLRGLLLMRNNLFTSQTALKFA